MDEGYSKFHSLTPLSMVKKSHLGLLCFTVMSAACVFATPGNISSFSILEVWQSENSQGWLIRRCVFCILNDRGWASYGQPVNINSGTVIYVVYIIIPMRHWENSDMTVNERQKGLKRTAVNKQFAHAAQGSSVGMGLTRAVSMTLGRRSC